MPESKEVRLFSPGFAISAVIVSSQKFSGISTKWPMEANENFPKPPINCCFFGILC